MWIPFIISVVVMATLWVLAPPYTPIDPRGRWVSGRDTLLIGGPTWGYFDGRHFVSRAHENRMLLHLPTLWPNDDAVVTIFADSLTMTTGIRTLLHEGDTLRVFKR